MASRATIDDQLLLVEALLQRAEREPDSLRPAESGRVKPESEPSIDWLILMKYVLGMADATDQEVLEVLRARVHCARASLTCTVYGGS